MFSLIVAIIVIVLVVAVAYASVYFGGSAFTDNSAKAQAATYANGAAQIDGAIRMYQNDNNGALPSSISQLVPNYLAAAPQGSWSFQNNYVVATGVSYNACLAANQAAGISTVPNCSDPSINPATPCCAS